MKKTTHSIRTLALALALGACAVGNRTRTDVPPGPVPDAGGPPVLYARDAAVYVEVHGTTHAVALA